MFRDILDVMFVIGACCLFLAFIMGCMWVVFTLAFWSLWTLIITAPASLFLVSAIIVISHR